MISFLKLEIKFLFEFNKIFKYIITTNIIKENKLTSIYLIGGTTPLWANPSVSFFRLTYVLCLICSLLFIGAYVGLNFFNGTLVTPTASSVSNNTSTNTTNLNNNPAASTSTSTNTAPAANTGTSTASNSSSTANTTGTSSSTGTNTATNKTSRTSFDQFSDAINSNSFSSESTESNINGKNSKAYDIYHYYTPGTENIVIDKNMAKQTTSATNTSTTSNSSTTTSTDENEKLCAAEALKTLNPSLVVIGGAILFLNGKSFYD